MTTVKDKRVSCRDLIPILNGIIGDVNAMKAPIMYGEWESEENTIATLMISLADALTAIQDCERER